MGHLWTIIQRHLDEYGVREAAFARRMDTSPQTLNSWKNRGLSRLPERWLLEAVARETRTPYEQVLDAVLLDIRYKDEEVVGDERDTAPMNVTVLQPEPSVGRPEHAGDPADSDALRFDHNEGGPWSPAVQEALDGSGEDEGKDWRGPAARSRIAETRQQWMRRMQEQGDLAARRGEPDQPRHDDVGEDTQDPGGESPA